MNSREIKEKLMDEGLSVADIARDLCETYTDVKYKSMYSMVYGMMFRNDYYAKYARELQTRHGITINRPKSTQSVRQQLKAA